MKKMIQKLLSAALMISLVTGDAAWALNARLWRKGTTKKDHCIEQLVARAEAANVVLPTNLNKLTVAAIEAFLLEHVVPQEQAAAAGLGAGSGSGAGLGAAAPVELHDEEMPEVKIDAQAFVAEKVARDKAFVSAVRHKKAQLMRNREKVLADARRNVDPNGAVAILVALENSLAELRALTLELQQKSPLHPSLGELEGVPAEAWIEKQHRVNKLYKKLLKAARTSCTQRAFNHQIARAQEVRFHQKIKIGGTVFVMLSLVTASAVCPALVPMAFVQAAAMSGAVGGVLATLRAIVAGRSIEPVDIGEAVADATLFGFLLDAVGSAFGRTQSAEPAAPTQAPAELATCGAPVLDQHGSMCQMSMQDFTALRAAANRPAPQCPQFNPATACPASGYVSSASCTSQLAVAQQQLSQCQSALQTTNTEAAAAAAQCQSQVAALQGQVNLLGQRPESCPAPAPCPAAAKPAKTRMDELWPDWFGGE